MFYDWDGRSVGLLLGYVAGSSWNGCNLVCSRVLRVRSCSLRLLMTLRLLLTLPGNLGPRVAEASLSSELLKLPGSQLNYRGRPQARCEEVCSS